MAEGARVESIDAIKDFRAALAKFAELAAVALDDAEGEVGRCAVWLEHEQSRYWAGQLKKRHELVNQCREAVRQKTLFKDSTGRTSSAIDEKKMLARAQAALAEAEQKIKAVERHARLIQRERSLYKGHTQRLQTTLGENLPNAIARMGNQIAALERYAAAAPTETASTAASTADTTVSDDPTAPSKGGP